MGFIGLLPPILNVIRKMYCKPCNSNIGEMTEVTIPHTYKLLEKKSKDTAWINAALKGMKVLSEGNTVTAVTLKPFGPSAGYYSELALMTLTYSMPNDPLSPPTDTIVKFLPIGFDKRLILDLVDLPKTECIMYYHLLRNHSEHELPPLPIMSPKILYADYCPATNNALMIMEKINFTLGDQKKAPDLDQAKAQMLCLAKVHAYYWGDKHPMNKLLTGPDNPICLIAALKMKMNIKKLLKMVKEQNNYEPSDAYKKALTTTFPDGFFKMLQWCNTSPYKTVVHGDARIDNVFFKTLEDGSLEAGLFDWAQAMVAPAFYEMSWAVSHSFTTKFHEEHGDDLLRIYWDSLMQLLGPQKASGLEYSEFLKGYAMAECVSVSKCVIAFESIQKDTKADDYPHKRGLVCNGIENSLKTMEKLDAIGAMEAILGGGATAKVAPLG